jgi:CRP-like cAMP-binding protein
MTFKHPETSLLIDVFGHIPPESLTRLQEIFFQRRYRAGEAIFLQGDVARSIYLVVGGRVKIERVTPDGNPCILCMRGPGEVFCPVPLLDCGCQLGTAWAMTDVTLLWADREAFGQVADDCPELLAEVQKDCLLEVRRLLRRMESYAFCNVRERVAITLLDESNRQQAFGESGDELRITQQELAALVGASRESVSRALSKLGDAGMVETRRGRVMIRDRRKLETIAKR